MADARSAKLRVHEMMQQTIPSPLHGRYYIPNQTDITAIKDRISASDEVIQQLETELSRVRKFNEYQRSLIAPIRRLPNELLEVIFIHTLSDEVIDIGGGRGGIWDLIQVCLLWREVITSSPNLWNEFKLSRVKTDRSDVVGHVRLCLTISGATPLKFSLLPTTSRSLPRRAMVELIRQAHRWYSVTAYADIFDKISNDEDLLAAIPQDGFSQLHQLYIKSADATDLWFPLNIFSYAERLENLYLDGIQIPDIWSHPSIRRLKMRDCKGIGVMSAIAKMPRLEEFSCISHEYDLDATFLAPAEKLLIPSLHFLNVSTLDPHPSWSSISVPSLTSFRLQNCLQNAEIFITMIKDSSSVISHLRLDYCSSETILNVLLRLKGIEELTMSLKPSHGWLSVFSVMIWDSSLHPQSGINPKLSPLLRTLVLNVTDDSEYPTIPDSIAEIMRSRAPATVVQLLEAREEAPAPLQKLTCNIHYNAENLPSDEFIRGYRTYLKRTGKETGIEVEIVITTDDEDVIDSDWDVSDDDNEEGVSSEDDGNTDSDSGDDSDTSSEGVEQYYLRGHVDEEEEEFNDDDILNFDY